MKINTKQGLLALNNEPLKDGDGKQWTVGTAISMILLTPKLAPAQTSKLKMLKAYNLANKFYNEEEVEVDDADLEDIKKEIQGYQNPIISGQLLTILK